MEVNTISYAFEKNFFRVPPGVVAPCMGYQGYYDVILNHSKPYLCTPLDDYSVLVDGIDNDDLISDVRRTILLITSGPHNDIQLFLNRIHSYRYQEDEWWPIVTISDEEFVAFRVMSDKYIYYVGLHRYGDILLIYCYDRATLEQYLAMAVSGFNVDIPGQDTVHVRFGDLLRINYAFGGYTVLPCYYIDKDRFAFGNRVCTISTFWTDYVNTDNRLTVIRHDKPIFAFRASVHSDGTDIYFCEQGSDYELQLNVDFFGDQACYAQHLNNLINREGIENYRAYDKMIIFGFNDEDL